VVRAEAGVFPFAVVADTRVSLVTAGLGYLLFDGFLVNRFGDLTWDGTTIMRYLTVFALAMGCGFLLRWIRHAVASTATAEVLDESTKESHGG
jgi:hypothetical protein